MIKRAKLLTLLLILCTGAVAAPVQYGHEKGLNEIYEFEANTTCIRDKMKGICVVGNNFDEPIECRLQIFGRTENGRMITNRGKSVILPHQYSGIELNMIGNYKFVEITATADCVTF
jgi:hypothetical protein